MNQFGRGIHQTTSAGGSDREKLNLRLSEVAFMKKSEDKEGEIESTSKESKQPHPHYKERFWLRLLELREWKGASRFISGGNLFNIPKKNFVEGNLGQRGRNQGAKNQKIGGGQGTPPAGA